jgi:hypothetical protein
LKVMGILWESEGRVERSLQMNRSRLCQGFCLAVLTIAASTDTKVISGVKGAVDHRNSGNQKVEVIRLDFLSRSPCGERVDLTVKRHSSMRADYNEVMASSWDQRIKNRSQVKALAAVQNFEGEVSFVVMVVGIKDSADRGYQTVDQTTRARRAANGHLIAPSTTHPYAIGPSTTTITPSHDSLSDMQHLLFNMSS